MVSLSLEVNLEINTLSECEVVVVDFVVHLYTGVAVAGLENIIKLFLTEYLENIFSVLVFQIKEISYILHIPLFELLHQLWREVGDLEEGRLVSPKSLHDHLTELHSLDGLRKPAVAADYVDHAMDKADGMLQNELLIIEEVRGQGDPTEMALEKNIGFGAWLIESPLFHVVGDESGESLDGGVLSVSDGDVLVFGGVGEYFDEVLDLTIFLDILLEDVDGGGVDVVIACQDAEVKRNELSVLLLLFDAFHFLEFLKGVLDHPGQVVVDGGAGDLLEVVVVRVLGQSPVHEGPGDPVDTVLWLEDVLCHDLGADVVIEAVLEVGLDGIGFIEHFFCRSPSWACGRKRGT